MTSWPLNWNPSFKLMSNWGWLWIENQDLPTWAWLIKINFTTIRHKLLSNSKLLDLDQKGPWGLCLLNLLMFCTKRANLLMEDLEVQIWKPLLRPERQIICTIKSSRSIEQGLLLGHSSQVMIKGLQTSSLSTWKSNILNKMRSSLRPSSSHRWLSKTEMSSLSKEEECFNWLTRKHLTKN